MSQNYGSRLGLVDSANRDVISGLLELSEKIPWLLSDNNGISPE